MKLHASDAKTDDSFGHSVAISGDTAVIGAFQEATGGFETGAAYVFERDQGGANAWGQVTKLRASDPTPNALFGCSVAISDDTVIVGADSVDSGFGAAYIFARNHGGTNAWGQVKKIRASDERAQHFGFSVAISGSLAIVGTLSGEAAYLFARDQGGSTNWGQVKFLKHGDVPILGSENVPPIGFGRAVAIAGDTAVVGAPQKAVGEEDGAHVFVRGDGPFNWGRVKVIAGRQSGGGQFGHAVAVFGDTAVVGAPQNALATGVHDGAAFLFERNRNGANNWGSVGGTKRGATAPSDPDHGASMSTRQEKRQISGDPKRVLFHFSANLTMTRRAHRS